MATALASTPSWQAAVRYCTSCYAIYRTDFERCPLDGAVLALSANDPLIGCSIGRYVIESKIGEGGMGRVYRAHVIDDPTREVAVKVLLGDLAASSVMRQRFAREAESARHLDHPHIVGVLDFGHTPAGLPFMAMELVEGTNLALILQKGPMQSDRVIRIARQLCEALDHAHSRGVIHRDFKPDNILVVNEGPDERVKIADFGLALSQNDETRLTMTGVACTPAYAAPEQLRGEAIDSRVDLYALGTTMFEMLTGGMLPFESDLQGTIRLKLAGEAPNLTGIVPDMQPALATLVSRLLASDPERRPRSARSLCIALDAALRAPKRKLRTADLAPQARGHTVSFPPTKQQRAATKRMRRATGVGTRTYVALAVAAVMIGAAIASIVRDREPQAEARTIEKNVALEVQAEPVRVASPVVSTPVIATPVAAPAKVAVAKAAPRVVAKPSRVVRHAATSKRSSSKVKRHAPVVAPVEAPVVAPVIAPVIAPSDPEAIIEDADVEAPLPEESLPAQASATNDDPDALPEATEQAAPDELR